MHPISKRPCETTIRELRHALWTRRLTALVVTAFAVRAGQTDSWTTTFQLLDQVWSEVAESRSEKAVLVSALDPVPSTRCDRRAVVLRSETCRASSRIAGVAASWRALRHAGSVVEYRHGAERGILRHCDPADRLRKPRRKGLQVMTQRAEDFTSRVGPRAPLPSGRGITFHVRQAAVLS